MGEHINKDGKSHVDGQTRESVSPHFAKGVIMKKGVSMVTAVFFFLIFAAAGALAGDNMIIFFKNGQKQTVDTDTVEKIEFQGKRASSGSFGGGADFLSGRTVSIVSKHSGKCLDVAGGATHNSANVYQWDCHGGANQFWTLTGKGGGYYLITAKHSGRCLDVENYGHANGTNVSQYDCHGGTNQLWSVIPQGGGYYLITAKHSGKCLDVAGVSKDRGANVYQWDCHGGDNQLWQLR
jgi:hypothetical protein